MNGNPSTFKTVVDVGCGFDADLSMYMIRNCNIKAFGIDPTLKHKEDLAKLSHESNGRFMYIPVAISHKNGLISFNESVRNVSGSILDEHKNINQQESRNYEVESINLSSLPDRLNLERIEYIKLDLEGAEYQLINELKETDLDHYEQLFIEFHHHAVPNYSIHDTQNCVKKMKLLGFKSFTINNHDYLFYK